MAGLSLGLYLGAQGGPLGVGAAAEEVAIELVQSGSNAVSSTTDPAVVTLSQTATAGNLLVAMGWYGTQAANDEIPTPGAGWTEVLQSGGTTGAHSVVMWYKVAAGDETNVTVTFPESISKQLHVQEWQGVNTLDQSAQVFETSEVAQALPLPGMTSGSVVVAIVGLSIVNAVTFDTDPATETIESASATTYLVTEATSVTLNASWPDSGNTAHVIANFIAA